MGSTNADAQLQNEIKRRKAIEEQLNLVIDAAPVGILSVNQEGRIVLANAHAQRIFGYEASELEGELIEKLIPETLRSRHEHQRREFMHKPETRVIGSGRDLVGRRKDGSEVPIEIGLNPIETPEGRGVLCTVVDITERKRAEKALTDYAADLKFNEAQIYSVFDAAPIGIISVDEQGRIVLANALARKIFGYTDSGLKGELIEKLIPQALRQKHERHRQGYLRNPEAREMGSGRDLYGLRKDGSEVPVEVGLNPIETPQGRSVLCTVVDITERKRSESALAEYAAQLKFSNNELEKFAYVVSHDLKAPLRGIATVAEWLVTDFADKVDDDARENLALMLERTHRLSRLIDGILQYSRVGRKELSRVSVDAHPLVVDVIDSISPPASIRVRIDGKLPTVVYDETQLRQVFQNLIGNAVVHLGRESGEIVISATRRDDMWIFSVRDNGVGIPQQHLERIFDLFQTLKSKDDGGSTGVGLSIVKRIVERNGGEVTVTSSEGAGADFSFTVPAVNSGQRLQPYSLSGVPS